MNLSEVLDEISTEHDLTPREIQILNLIVNGYTNNEIAAYLEISPKTVRNHMNNIFSKVDVHASGRKLYSKIIFKLLG